MKFFVGIYAVKQIDYVPVRFMFSFRRLKKKNYGNRVSDLKVRDCGKEWIMDSGGFSEIKKFGRYSFKMEDYQDAILFYKPSCFINMDWMCEPFILVKTGLSVREHQERSTENHIKLKDWAQNMDIEDKLIGVIQGYEVDDYLKHVDMLKSQGLIQKIMCIGSLCKRQRENIILTILQKIKENLPNHVRLHGLGIKISALKKPFIYQFLDSCDSMAWSYGGRKMRKPNRGEVCIFKNKICSSKAQNCANCEFYMIEWTLKVERLIAETSKQKTLMEVI